MSYKLKIRKLFGIVLIVVAQKVIMYTFVQGLKSVACHLKLVILSTKLRITEHAQSSGF